MTDLWKLLKEARDWVDQVGGEFEYRPDEIDPLVARIDAALAEHEPEPERKCRTCRYYYKDEAWCRNDASPCYSIAGPLSEDWFCADWQRME